MAQSPEYPDLRWIPPKSYTPGRPSGQPTKITIHYTAGAEGPSAAENGALYDQRRTDGTSAHYYVDSDSVVQCVRTTDRSHTALFHGNRDGIHYELCGTVQSRAQWLDGVSRATIRNAAKQIARDMRKYGIPLVRLVNTEVRSSSAKGICGHVDWTNGWPEDGGTHTDPGTQFPYDVLFDDIRAELDGTQEDDMDKLDRLLMPQGERPTNSAPRPDIAATDAWTLALLNAEHAADGVDDIKAQLAQPTPVTLTAEQMDQLAARLAALVPTAEQIAVAVADEDHRRSAG